MLITTSVAQYQYINYLLYIKLNYKVLHENTYFDGQNLVAYLIFLGLYTFSKIISSFISTVVKSFIDSNLSPRTVLRREMSGRINSEYGVNRYKLLYIEQISNRDLLYNTGNNSQYCIINFILLGDTRLATEPKNILERLLRLCCIWWYLHAITFRSCHSLFMPDSPSIIPKLSIFCFQVTILTSISLVT